MSNIMVGMLAKSLAGHDKDSIYFIQGENRECVELVDGKIRTVDRPKRKKKKHIQVIRTACNIEETQSVEARNQAIKKLIKTYKKEHNI